MRRRAFTLIELVVVIAVVGVIAAVAAVGYSTFTSNARETSAKSTMSQVARLLQANATSTRSATGEFAALKRSFAQYGLAGSLPDEVTAVAITSGRELLVGYDNGLVCFGLTFGPTTGASATGDPQCVDVQDVLTPTGFSLTSGDSRLVASWDEVSQDNPASAVAVYTLEYSSDGGATWSAPADLPGSTSSALIPSLVNGVAYQVRLTATNFAGQSASVSDTQTPATTPATPSDVLLSMGDRFAKIYFTPGDNGGAAVTAHNIQMSVNDGPWQDLPPGAAESPLRVEELTPGDTYGFRIQAVNRIGTSAWSEPTGDSVAIELTSKVRNLTVVPDANEELTVSWSAPSFDGYGTISGYVVSYSTDGSTWQELPTEDLTATLTGLEQYTEYTVRVAAINEAGTGPWQVADPIMPNRGPSAPTIDRVRTDNNLGWLRVYFSSPASTGLPAGTPLTGYTLSYSPAGQGSWRSVNLSATATNYAISGLDQDAQYDIALFARSAGGDGVPVQVLAKTMGAPSAPGSVSVVPTPTSSTNSTPRQQSLTVSFAPSTPGGDNATTYYDIEYRPVGSSTWYTVFPEGAAYNQRMYSSASTVSFTINNLSAYSRNSYAGVQVNNPANPALLDATSYEVRVTPYSRFGPGPSALGQGATASASVPAAPSVSAVVPSTSLPGRVSVRVEPVSDDGGAPVLSYTTQYRVADGPWVDATRVDSYANRNYSSTPTTVQTLTLDGVPYGEPDGGASVEFRVTAANWAGSSAPSSVYTQLMPVTPVPTRVTVAQYTASVDELIMRVSISLPRTTSTDPVMVPRSYQVGYKLSGQEDWTDVPDSTTSTVDVPGLQPGQSYDWRVRVVSDLGAGSWFDLTSTTPFAPELTGLSVDSLSTTDYTMRMQASLAAVPSGTARAATLYEFEYKPSSSQTWVSPSGTSTSNRVNVGGLSAGTAYDWRVRISSINGTSDWLEKSQFTPSASTAPTLSQPTATSMRVTASSAPQRGYVYPSGSTAASGYATIRSYELSYRPVGNGSWSTLPPIATTSTAATFTLPGLTSGQEYEFSASVTLSWGTSPAATGTYTIP